MTTVPAYKSSCNGFYNRRCYHIRKSAEDKSYVIILNHYIHALIQKVLSEGVQLWQRFFYLIRVHITVKAGHHRPTSETPFKKSFRLQVDDGPKLNASLVALRLFRGSRAVLLRNAIFL